MGTEPVRVLAIDDNEQLLLSLARLLRHHGFELNTYTSPADGLATLKIDPLVFDLLVVDVQMPEMNGLEVLAQAREIDPDLPVIMLTADATAQTAVTALKLGAFDYLVKPFSDSEELALKLSRAASFGRLSRKARHLEQRLAEAERFERLIGESKGMRELYSTIDRIAPADVNVLVLGESGTGKELVARAIHARSRASAGPFVAFNCGAVPPELVDSELFGHARGAFTGAVREREGLFVEADGGTLFLDEVGDVPLAVQVRLLRVLQEGELRQVGGSGTRQVFVRVIAATNVDLERAVREGRFREDLFYRLNVVSIRVPPLRDRISDVPLLAAHFVDKHARGDGRAPGFSPEALEALTAYAWPGNVRELENAILRSLALTRTDIIGLDALPPKVAQAPSPEPPAVSQVSDVADDLGSYQDARNEAMRAFERRFSIRLLSKTSGNIAHAARLAGLDRANFRRILARNDIDAGAYRKDG